MTKWHYWLDKLYCTSTSTRNAVVVGNWLTCKVLNDVL